jgi:hypothetical protein
MRRSMLIPVMMAAMVVGASGQRAPSLSSLTGVLVDRACYLSKGAAIANAAEHKACAIACAQKGSRLAVVLANGSVYIITGALTADNNVKLLPFVYKPVVLTATLGSVTVSTAVVSDGLTSETSGLTAEVSDGLTGGVLGVDTRLTGEQVGVASKQRFRKGDFREGDIPNTAQPAIDAITIALTSTK